MVVICTLSIMLSNGYKLVEQVQGIELKEAASVKKSINYLYVDFEKELKKRKYKLQKGYSYVQWVNENNCYMLKASKKNEFKSK